MVVSRDKNIFSTEPSALKKTIDRAGIVAPANGAL
jgi:hypothetical protein